MPRGGVRKGAGKKTSWKSGCKFNETKLIRVPSTLASQLLDLAHWLDEGGEIEKVTKSIQCELPLVSANTIEVETKSNLFTQAKLSVEIGVGITTLKRHKKSYLDGVSTESDFYSYLSEHDPLSRNWRYCRDTKKYYFE